MYGLQLFLLSEHCLRTKRFVLCIRNFKKFIEETLLHILVMFILYRGLMRTLVFKAVCHNNLTTGLVAVSYPDWSYRNNESALL